MGHKVIALNGWWASLLASIIAASVVASAAYAWTANAELAVLKRDVSEMKQADLPVRLARMEEKINESAIKQARIEDKLDKLIDKIRYINN